MRKHLTVFLAVLIAVLVAMPAFAAVEFKYGGQFRTRFDSANNVYDGTSDASFFDPGHFNGDDNLNFFDQRMRLYFSFIASKNLKLVYKLEVGDVYWGNATSSLVRTGPGSGGGVGADGVNVETKNAYIEFNIPNTPSTALVGIQTITLLDSWIVDDDFSAAVLVTKLDPFRVTLGYVAGLSGGVTNATQDWKYTDPSKNIDAIAAALDYAQGPWKGSLIFFYENNHTTIATIDPTTLSTPVGLPLTAPLADGSTVPSTSAFLDNRYVKSNDFFDLGFNVTYKIDWLSAYVNFAKNFGSVDFEHRFDGEKDSVDYTGWMIDAGITYFCGPYTLNVGGFYTSGPDRIADNDDHDTMFDMADDVSWFTYSPGTSKYFSELIGGGVLGDNWYTLRGFPSSLNGSGVGSSGGLQAPYWKGYNTPYNLWTITAGGSWQVAEKTKLSASYWYFGTSEDVPVRNSRDNPGRFEMSSSIGHELDFYVDQGITDGLVLTLVGAYLIADDAFCPVPSNIDPGVDRRYNTNHADDAYEIGARLQWNF